MSPADEHSTDLVDTARQLLAAEKLFGGEFLPADRVALPEFEPPPREDSSPDDQAAALAELDASEVQVCRKCDLCKTRTTVVFGEGSASAELVFVGEGPGAEEDRQGRPFVGRAGELLTKMIHAMGLTREDVFICNMVKCRPPGNRTPNPPEIESCWGYLVRQLEIIRPRAIVTLGNPATQNLLDVRTGITRMRGHWRELPPIGDGLGGTPVMPTFHPAYLLRNYSVDTRRKVWADLQAVMKLLGLEPPTSSDKGKGAT